MMLLLYNLLFPLVFLFFLPGLVTKLIRRPGHKSSFAERLAIFSPGKKQRLRESAGAVWIHAVSVGETMVALALIKRWREKFPARKFVLSTTTTTGQSLAIQRVPADVPVIFCPLDFIFFVRRTVALLQPRLLVILETEIWPELIAEVRRRGGKTALVNARMSDKSCRGYYRFRMFFRPVLEMFNLIAAQSNSDRDRFSAIAPAAPVITCGNMKFDQKVPGDLPSVDLEPYFGTGRYPILLAASTHPGEEELVAATYLAVKNRVTGLKLIIIPRHAERGAEVVAILKKLNLSFHRRTAERPADMPPVDCLLADTTGEMLSFMNVADVVIMGKSLAGQNEGHNLIEPALLAKPVVCGSVLKNFRFVLNVLKENDAIVTIDRDNELAGVLEKLFNDADLRIKIGVVAKRIILGQMGATDTIIKLLEEML